MITPADARRLVKNRKARAARAETREELEADFQLDYTEELVSEYISNEGFADIFENELEQAVTEAINYELPLCIGFTTRNGWSYTPLPVQGGVYAGQIGFFISDSRRMDPYYGLIFDLAAVGFEERDEYLEEVFAGAMAQMCIDAGWEPGELENTYAHKLDDDREPGPDNVWESHYSRGLFNFFGFELPY